jgi:hypothetical protein
MRRQFLRSCALLVRARYRYDLRCGFLRAILIGCASAAYLTVGFTFQDQDSVPALGAFLGALILVGAVAYAIHRLSIKKLHAVMCATAVSAGVGLVGRLGFAGGGYRQEVGTGLMCAGAFVAAVLVLARFSWYITWRLWASELVRRRPVSALIIGMSEIVLALDGLYMSQMRTRRHLVFVLDMCARAVEHGLPRLLLLPAQSAGAVYRERLARSAAAIRGFQLWVALPNSGTWAELRRRCIGILGTVLLKEFDSLPDDVPLPLDPPTRLRIVVAWLRTLVVAAVPLAVTLALRHLAILPAGTWTNSALLISVVWAAVALMMLIDPLFTARMSAVKDLTSILRGGGSGKG